MSKREEERKRAREAERVRAREKCYLHMTVVDIYYLTVDSLSSSGGLEVERLSSSDVIIQLNLVYLFSQQQPKPYLTDPEL